MNPIPLTPVIRMPAKIGAWIFALWGVLHVWVGAEGVRQYVTAGPSGLWNMLIGGSAVPRESFVHVSDPATLFAHAQIVFNFCLDVGGYGVLGFFVAWLILKRDPWVGFLLGLVIIGISDLSFMFLQLIPGVIELNAGTIGGPVLWLLAVLITPFGMPKASDRS